MVFPVRMYIGIGIIVVVVVSLLLLGMRGWGRLIECPECSSRFKRPALAEKSSGVGFTLPGIGSFTCPKCSYRGSTSSFRYVDEGS